MNVSGPTSSIAPSKLKYKHAIQIANMIRPYIRDFQRLRAESQSEDAESFGMTMFEHMIEKAPEDVANLIADIRGCSVDDVYDMGIDDLLQWVEVTLEANNVAGFTSRVRGLMSKASASRLQNLSNASTVGQTNNSIH